MFIFDKASFKSGGLIQDCGLCMSLPSAPPLALGKCETNLMLNSTARSSANGQSVGIAELVECGIILTAR